MKGKKEGTRGGDYWVAEVGEHGKYWLGMITDLNIFCIMGLNWK